MNVAKPLWVILMLTVAGGWVSSWLMAGDVQATPMTKPLQRQHRGVDLVALAPPSPNPYDIELIEPGKALDNIESAIKLIYSASPFSAERIDRLKSKGRVVIIYDPTFPKPDMASQIIAAFFPDHFQHDGFSREFRVVVGRFGAKWSEKELAAVIVHELVGHGLQHLEGKTKTDRKIDRECNALIHEEKAYQDFAYKRDSSEMVRFRRDMRQNWCGDFNRYMSARNIHTDEAWGYGKPDVPKLLEIFERYTAHLRKSGVAARALKATDTAKQQQFEAYLKTASKRNDAAEMFEIAGRFLKGIGTAQDENTARKWYLRAARANHPGAQFYLGALLENGIGGPEDKVNAHKWYSIAAENGINKAGIRKASLTPLLSLSELSIARERAQSWWSARRQ